MDIEKRDDKRLSKAIEQFFYNNLLHKVWQDDPSEKKYHSIYDRFRKELNHAIAHHFRVWRNGQSRDEFFAEVVQDIIMEHMGMATASKRWSSQKSADEKKFKEFIEQTVRDETRRIIVEKLTIKTISTIDFDGEPMVDNIVLGQ